MATTGDPSATPGAAPWAVSRGAAEAGELGRCAWCGAPFAGTDAEPGRGRRDCARCGAATTDPWPTAAELEHAYARYRPEDGRFSGSATPCCAAPARAWPRASIAWRRPGRCSTWAPATVRCSTRFIGAGPRGARPRARLAARGRPRGRHHESRGTVAAIVFWHSLEHLPAPGRRDRRRAQRLPARGGALLVAVPNSDSLQARVFGDRWFHLDLPRHLVHLSARALTAPPARARPDGDPGQPLARRPGAVRLAARARGHPPGRARPLRRDPSARGAQPADAGAAAGAGAGRRDRAVPGRRRWPPPRRSPCGGAAPSTSRRVVAERPAGKVIVVMPAMNAARTLERTVEAIPRDWVDEIVLVDDASSDETVELARQPAAARGLAPAQRGLRRQPEDVLPRGPAARRRRRRDAASRRPVRAGADPEHGRADPGRAGGPRARLAAGAAGHGPGQRHAALEVRGQPLAHRGREPDHGHAPVRGPYRLPGLLAPAAPDRPVPAQLVGLQLRLGAADAGLPLRHAHRGGARARTLLRGGVVGGPGQRHRLRAQDALDRGPPCAAPSAHPARRRKFKSPTARIDPS